MIAQLSPGETIAAHGLDGWTVSWIKNWVARPKGSLTVELNPFGNGHRRCSPGFSVGAKGRAAGKSLNLSSQNSFGREEKGRREAQSCVGFFRNRSWQL